MIPMMLKSDESALAVYNHTMEDIKIGYQALLDADCRPQDARGVLPTNILTNILFKVNLLLDLRILNVLNLHLRNTDWSTGFSAFENVNLLLSSV